jgi:hypothetical protein
MNHSISNSITITPSSPRISERILPDKDAEPTILTHYPSLQPSAPPSTELISSSSVSSAFQPPVPEESKEVKFQIALLKILQRLLSSDFSLLQNLIEQTKNIILHADELYELISILCQTTRIDIISQPIFKGCACSEKLIYYKIERIVVNGYDLMIAFNDVFNMLKSNNVSLDHVIPSDYAL